MSDNTPPANRSLSRPSLPRSSLPGRLLMSAGLSFLAAMLPGFAQAQESQAPACTGEDEPPWGIIVHGGTTGSSGTASAERLDFLKALLADRRAELEAGASALDVVEAAIVAMENSGLFNAGKGAIHNAEGFVETDASIMEGAQLQSGAVASMLRVKNPISAARIVMDETRHAIMVGDRGEKAVTERGAETVEPAWFLNNPQEGELPEHGTVGAAALDRCGNMAAGTSTGGYDAKIPGRVGDSPIIGASTYAQNGVMAASATGHGEYFIRFTATRAAAARMEYGGMDLADATKASIDEMAEAGGGTAGRGGIVAIDAAGNVAFPFSTPGMYRGYANAATRWSVGVFGDMESDTAAQ